MSDTHRRIHDGAVAYGDPRLWANPEEWEAVHVFNESELAAEKAIWQAEAWDEGWEARHNYDERAGEPPPPNPYEKGSDDDRL